MTQTIEFVYFDLGNVLLAFDPKLACQNVAIRFGVTEHQAQSAIYDSGLEDRFEHGQLSGEEFASEVRERLGQSATQMPTEALLDAVSDMFTPIQEMEGVLQRVRDGGSGVGLLSNTCQAHWDWIVRQSYRVLEFTFDATILSFEVGSMKPQDAIYQDAEQSADVPPEKILFLDDKQENVEAAIARRWNANCVVGGLPVIETLRVREVAGWSN